MNKFEIEIVNYFDEEAFVAEIYYSNSQWAKIFCENKEFKVQFYPHPNKGSWEFPFEEALKTLEDAENRLLKKFGTKSSFFSNGSIDPKKVNEQAQEILEKILNHPEKIVVYGELSRFGKVMDIYAPNIGGARYTVDEEFIGFLEL